MDIQKKKVEKDIDWSASKKVAFAAAVGMSAVSLTSCADPKPEPLAGDVAVRIEQVDAPADSNEVSSDSSEVSSDSVSKICEKDSLNHQIDSIPPALVGMVRTASEDESK